MDRLKLADALEKGIADPDSTPDMVGEYVRMHLPTILSALRDAGTGRDSGEAMRESCARWHDGEARRYVGMVDNAEDRILGAAAFQRCADDHRSHAAAIRALPLQTGSEGHE